MDDNAKRIPQQSPVYAIPPSQQTSTPAMSVSIYNRSYDSTSYPQRHEPGRYPGDHRYDSNYLSRDHQDQRLQTYHVPPNTRMQGVPVSYSPFINNGGRVQTMSHPSSPVHFVPYTAGSMLPPLQHNVPFDTFPQFQSRNSSFLGSNSDPYAMTAYVPSNDPTPHINAGHSQQDAGSVEYQSIPVCRPEVTDGMSHRIEAIPSMGPNISQEQQPQNNTSIMAQNTRPPHTIFPYQDTQTSDLQAFEEQLKMVFEALITGRLNEASTALLGATRWLLSSIEGLGLHHDDETEYEHRMILWREFNHCWEALAQKQKRTVETEIQINRLASDKLDAETVRHLVDELVSLCDRVEQYGLIDYEMGVWEEQIVNVFIECLDQLEERSRQEILAMGSGY